MLTYIKNGVCAPAGFTAAGVHCGIRKNKSKLDLALIFSDKPCSAAAVYTQNLVKGAPITVTQNNLSNGIAQAVICNSGNANTCNADGINKAETMCEIAAEVCGISPSDVIVASTGVIGQSLDITPIQNIIGQLANELSYGGGASAAKAIMTTDTIPKEYSVELSVNGSLVRIGGMAKGSGMLSPDMATMLSFITTDADISAAMLGSARKSLLIFWNGFSISPKRL